MLYVPETDALEIVHRDALGPVDETLPGPRGWITIDVDENNRLVSMTIEHATEHAPPHVRLAEARRLVGLFRRGVFRCEWASGSEGNL